MPFFAAWWHDLTCALVQHAGVQSDGKWQQVKMEIKPQREAWEQNKDLEMIPMGSVLDIHGFTVPGTMSLSVPDAIGSVLDIHGYTASGM